MFCGDKYRKLKGGEVVLPKQYSTDLFDPWWDRVTKTYCPKCKKLMSTHHYQGHFICDECGSLTGFWITPPGYQLVRQPMRWNNKNELVTVRCEMRYG